MRNSLIPAFPRDAWRPLAALGFIGGLFALKYGPRAGISAWTAGFGYLAFFLASTFLGTWIASRMGERRKGWGWFVFAGAALVAFFAAAYVRVPAETLQIDRASAFENFWDAFFRGEFPYAARSHLDNALSGFPMLFALALPFHAIGDVGLLQFAGLSAFAGLLFARFRARPGVALCVLIALAAFPPFAYEVLARSDLFTNFTLVAILLHVSLGFAGSAGAARAGGNPGARAGKSGAALWIFAVVWGLALSTRSAVAAPFLFAAFPLLRGRALAARAGFFAVAGGVCALTFLPFVLWDPALFAAHNPLDVQGFYMPTWGGVLLLAVCAALAWKDGERPRPFARAGFVLFFTVLACAAGETLKSGWHDALWGSLFNITYFTLAAPFLLVDLGDRLARPSTPRAV